MHRKKLPHFAVAILLVAVSVFYFDTWRSMVSVWTSSSTFVHGFLILPMSAFLIWRMRSTWIGLAARPSFVGLFLLVLSVLALRVADLAAVQVVAHFAVVAMLVTAVWTVYGFEIVRVLHFPLLYAFFTVPFGEFLIPSLMDWTASFAVSALQLTGIPVLREGHFILLPNGNFRVIEACSGVRFLIVTVVLGLFFAHNAFASQRKQFLFISAAAAAIIIANGARAYTVVLVGHLSEMRFGSGQEHIYVGWLVFLLTISALFWVGRRYEDAEVVLGGRKANEGDSTESQSENAIVKLVLVSSVSLVTLVLGSQLVNTNESSIVRSYPPPQLPIAVVDWSGPGTAELPYRPEFVGQSAYTAGRYEGGAQAVEVHVVFYAYQKQGAELVGFQNRLFDPDLWRSVPDSRQDGGSSSGLPGDGVTITNGRRTLRMRYWYDIGGHVVSSPTMAKLVQVWNALTVNNSGDAVVVVVTQAGDLDGDSTSLQTFIGSHGKALSDCLRPQSVGDNLCAGTRQ